jgi:hypothetical protein
MNEQLAFVMAPAVAVVLGSAASAGTIYDNGLPNGVTGLSMLFGGGFDASREVADDFVLKGGPGWLVDGMAISYIWDDGAGLGQFGDFLVEIYADDAGGGPGTVLSSQIVPLAGEFLTGDTYFGRPEIRVSVDIAPVALDADTTYWVALTPFAPQNGFVLTSHSEANGDIIGSGVYIRFPKFGFPDWAPGAELFGEGYDISFSLQGEVIPAPGTLALLGFAGLLGPRRRRR